MIGDAACDAIASETGGRSAVATFAARKRQLPQTSEGGEDRILQRQGNPKRLSLKSLILRVYTKEKKRDNLNKRVPPRLPLPSHDGQGCVVCEFREFKWIGLLEQVHCVLGASAPFPSHLPSFSRPTQRHRVLSRPPLVFGNPRGSLTLYLS